MAAYLFDAAITACGIAVDNALTERVNNGSVKEPKWETKYTLHQILDPVFRLPEPPPPPKVLPQAQQPTGFSVLLALAGQPGSNVKRWEYVKPS